MKHHFQFAAWRKREGERFQVRSAQTGRLLGGFAHIEGAEPFAQNGRSARDIWRWTGTEYTYYGTHQGRSW